MQRYDIAYLHMRSAGNNCFQVRIERVEPGKLEA